MKAKETEGGGKSFWTTLPGILTGVAAVITALTGVVALMIGGSSSPQPEPPSPPPVQQGAGGPPPSPPAHAVDVACLSEVFEGVPGERIRPVSAGAADVVVVRTDQTKAEPFALELRDAGVVVGGMLLSYDVDSDRYAIRSVVNASCEPAAVRNEDMPGEGSSTFPSWTGMRIDLGERAYIIELGYTSGQIEVNEFRRFVS